MKLLKKSREDVYKAIELNQDNDQQKLDCIKHRKEVIEANDNPQIKYKELSKGEKNQIEEDILFIAEHSDDPDEYVDEYGAMFTYPPDHRIDGGFAVRLKNNE